jgi:DoxX-like family
MTMTQPAISQSSTRKWNFSLWTAQILLAVLFGYAGVIKSLLPIPDLAAMLFWPGDLPVWLVRFIGAVEFAGALGMILPAATRILPGLTPLAALGFVVIQCLAIPFHAMRGELAMALPINLVLLLLSVFVLWGRSNKAPITARR